MISTSVTRLSVKWRETVAAHSYLLCIFNKNTEVCDFFTESRVTEVEITLTSEAHSFDRNF